MGSLHPEHSVDLRCATLFQVQHTVWSEEDVTRMSTYPTRHADIELDPNVGFEDFTEARENVAEMDQRYGNGPQPQERERHNDPLVDVNQLLANLCKD